MMRLPLALALALAAVLLLARAAGAQEKTDFKEQGGEEKKKDADEEEDVVPDHEDTEENLGPFQLRKPKYKIIPGDEDPQYFGKLGLQRLAPIPAVRRAFREEARKYRDVLMRCNQPECFPQHPWVRGNATVNAMATNSSAANPLLLHRNQPLGQQLRKQALHRLGDLLPADGVAAGQHLDHGAHRRLLL